VVGRQGDARPVDHEVGISGGHSRIELRERVSIEGHVEALLCAGQERGTQNAHRSIGGLAGHGDVALPKRSPKKVGLRHVGHGNIDDGVTRDAKLACIVGGATEPGANFQNVVGAELYQTPRLVDCLQGAIGDNAPRRLYSELDRVRVGKVDMDTDLVDCGEELLGIHRRSAGSVALGIVQRDCANRLGQSPKAVHQFVGWDDLGRRRRYNRLGR
jgi:hypothetical protein